jgi:DNA-binding NarL/FixJ family response regulator
VVEHKRIRVVIADASSSTRERLVALLEEWSGVVVVAVAADARQACAAIERLHPEVVILDTHMPAGGGLSVLRWAQPRLARPHFIVLTNYAYPQYRRTCLEAGASYFFDKSSEFEQIPQALRQLQRSGLVTRPQPGPRRAFGAAEHAASDRR